MKKLILSSSGLDNEKIIDYFLKLSGKKLKKTKILVIMYFTKPKHFKFKEEILGLLTKLGLSRSNIFIVDISKNPKPKDYPKTDIIYFKGGDTFYYLDKIRKTGFDKYIKKHINSGKLYFGESAGSVIVSKTIEIAEIAPVPDKNEIGIRDYTGLGVIDFAIYPHYLDEQEKELNKLKKKLPYRLIELRDKDFVIVRENTIKVFRRKQ